MGRTMNSSRSSVRMSKRLGAGWGWARGVLLTGSLLLGVVGTALAHAALVKAEPAQRTSLTKAPTQLRLWFSERLEPAYAEATLTKEGAREPIAAGKAKVDPNEPKLLVLELPALEPGRYVVKYRVLSVDGHTVDYGYTFSVTGGPTKP
ncbi:copper resistance CopC family protein [Methylibium sp.]|uniref:copper resistance CopC family protein n=1 Tax=Methylibium sp. TaxID=2067992 RepID=UPI003D099D6A